MGKYDTVTAKDVRSRATKQAYTFDGVMEMIEETIKTPNSDGVALWGGCMLADGVKEKLEKLGFKVRKDKMVPDPFNAIIISWEEEQEKDAPQQDEQEKAAPKNTNTGSGRSHPGLDELWVDTATQAREIARANISDIQSILECVYFQARKGQMRVEVPSIAGSPLEQELHRRGFSIRHMHASPGYTSEISW